MRRRCRSLSLSAALLATALGALFATGTDIARAAANTTAPCVVRVTHWFFQPSTAAAGEQTQLTLTIRNCTQQVRQVSVLWFGSGRNCPTVDPAPPTSTRLGPGERKTRAWQFTAPPCGPTGGQENATVRVSNRAGRHLASRVTTLTVTAA